ncbi:glucose receptor git3 protein [Diplodia corticola]|uniref:Glucose receptor git3 protein n=1 Tax=Diplodia corticola TaxID=236234 RepID=A0A1J9QL07_9PEZI|nr:glucose receptor git3 protein [Diplodia corticola]OJD29152.1 glucose receptor git3 protein [Diplodia corticola]
MIRRARDVSDLATGWDPAIAIPTLVGSLLSFLASSMVITLWAVFGAERRSFRYALILNLTVAEFINSLNNTISGIYIISNHGSISDGPTCDLNGWVGQFSVQAVDFSILAIAVVTLLTIQFKSYILYAPTYRKVLICLSIWAVPLVTSSTALGLGVIAPVSGNWCWIARDRRYLRYALGHAWRIAILVLTFAIYVYVFAFMYRRLRLRREADGGGSSGSSNNGRSYSFDLGDPAASNGFEMNFWLGNGSFGGGRKKNNNNSNEKGCGGDDLEDGLPLPPPKAFAGTRRRDEATEKLIPLPRVRIRHTADIDKDVWRMVLLNLYPVTYLVLWLPGLANRIFEATGQYSRPLSILQSSTQYVGFANACVYGFKEHWGDIKFWWEKGRR